MKSRHRKYLLEEAGSQVRGLALAEATGLGEYGGIKAGQKQGEGKKARFALKALVSAAITRQMDK